MIINNDFFNDIEGTIKMMDQEERPKIEMEEMTSKMKEEGEQPITTYRPPPPPRVNIHQEQPMMEKVSRH